MKSSTVRTMGESSKSKGARARTAREQETGKAHESKKEEGKRLEGAGRFVRFTCLYKVQREGASGERYRARHGYDSYGRPL